MPGAPQNIGPFNRLITALAPWLDQIVVVGGWAHQLYRLHPRAQQLNYPPLSTLDTDIAVPTILPIREQDIRARLLAHGFNEEFFGEDRPPATHYCLGDEASGFYAEFLSPLCGSDADRNQRRKTTVEISGIVSQQLRHIELLLSNPWTIDFESGGFTARIQIPNPVSFLAQKALIHGERNREDRAKDILYMHDTIGVFGERLPELRRLWLEVIAGTLHPNSKKKVPRASRDLFGAVTDDIRRAGLISPERRLSPEVIQQVCRSGFVEIFG
jgi:Nucleotidyltransferase